MIDDVACCSRELAFAFACDVLACSLGGVLIDTAAAFEDIFYKTIACHISTRKIPILRVRHHTAKK